ncbi:MAG: peptidylprolyl isomerase [Anaerolineae bacterium]|nr:peptidylprolyl isomerase [Anaerolineae bacterium]
MAKSRKTKQAGRLTKKQVHHSRRESQQLKWIWISTGTLVAVIVIILVIGLVSQNAQVVAVVNGKPIRLPEYQKRVRFWYHYYNGFLMPGAVDRLETEQRTEFYQGIVSELIDEKLVLQEVTQRGLSVGEEAVQIELEEGWFQHYRVPLTPTPSPTADPQVTPTEEATPLPTATPDTPEAFQAQYDEFKDTVLKSARVSEAYFRDMIRTSLLKKELENVLVTDVPTEEEQVHFRYTSAETNEDAMARIATLQAGVEEQVHARHILVATQEEAESVLARLEVGEDFIALAAELSTDESNKDLGGDLGWFGRGQMVEPFEEAAFTGDIGLYPTPVETQFGFHILDILAREDREIDMNEALYDMGWIGRTQLADQFGPLFAEILFSSEIGLITEPIPTEYGTAIVEVLDHQIKTLDEAEREQSRAQLFEQELERLRQEADIQDMWGTDMVPRQM